MKAWSDQSAAFVAVITAENARRQGLKGLKWYLPPDLTTKPEAEEHLRLMEKAFGAMRDAVRAHLDQLKVLDAATAPQQLLMPPATVPQLPPANTTKSAALPPGPP